MSEKEFKRKAYVLGKEHTLDVMKYLHSNGWAKSSTVAKHCGLHIATASKYLEELHEIGLVDSRVGKGRTRKVVEYRLKDPKIELSMDISKWPREVSDLEASIEFYRKLFNSLLERTRDFFGTTPGNMKKIPPFSEYDKSTRGDLISALRELMEHNEKRIGLDPTTKLINRACGEHVQEFNSDVKKLNLLDELPKKYTDTLEVK